MNNTMPAGGSRSNSASILTRLHALNEAQDELTRHSTALQQAQDALQAMSTAAATYKRHVPNSSHGQFCLSELVNLYAVQLHHLDFGMSLFSPAASQAALRATSAAAAT